MSPTEGSGFRKRRLSLPRIHVAAQAQDEPDDAYTNEPVGASLEEEAEEAYEIQLNMNPKPTRLASPSTPSSRSDGVPFSSPEDKAQTFRKRRLSVNNLQHMEQAVEGVDEDEPELAHIVKKRRASVASNASLNSVHSESLTPRIQHAYELLHDTETPIHSDVIYQQQALPHPSSFQDLPQAAEDAQQPPAAVLQPRWKTRHHLTDGQKLPFPKEVVGTYSCHGIEPVYDDYEDTDEEPCTTTALQPSTIKMVAKINQDRGGVSYPYASKKRQALFAVYDGHGQGGELVSQFALHEIQKRLQKHESFEKDLHRAMKETFVEVDEALRDEPLIEPLFCGTTACVALLQDKKLTLANAGDSRAVLARRHALGGKSMVKALDLTIDQNPDLPDECHRILSHGGYVSMPPAPGLSARVWLDASCTQIGLAMARSIGDHAVAPVGVIAEPVVTEHELEPEDLFMIIASDGVWEFLDSTRAVQIVSENLHQGATRACQALIEAAAAVWHQEEGEYRDDITAIVVKFVDIQDSWNANKL